MCGRFYNNISAVHEWMEVLDDWPAGYETGYNVAPTQQVPIVTGDGTVPARWGMIPAWSKEFRSKYSTFNARIESVEKSPLYRGAWKHSRTCLVPAGGYYEWVTATGKKLPYLLHKPDDLLAFAGLWEPWEEHLSFTILTEDARGELLNIHNRMPVMLDPNQARDWLKHGTAKAESILVSNVYQSVAYYAVSTQVNNVKNQGPELIQFAGP